MNKPILIILLFPILAFSQRAEITPSTKTQIAILGMFHLGVTNDLASVKIKNLHGEKRQAEIKSIVKKLMKYNPTKIMVEYPAESDERLFASYTHYLSGKDTLRSSETYQIGFRLAKALGHKKLYGIDHPLEMPMQNLMAYCQQNGKMDDFQELIKSVSEFANTESDKLESMSLTDFLAYMNSEAYDRTFYNLYFKDMLPYGTVENEAGIEYTVSWYKRNLNIFKNLTEALENQNERVLVIIGSNHRAGLKEFIKARDDMEFVAVADYLK